MSDDEVPLSKLLSRKNGINGKSKRKISTKTNESKHKSFKEIIPVRSAKRSRTSKKSTKMSSNGNNKVQHEDSLSINGDHDNKSIMDKLTAEEKPNKLASSDDSDDNSDKSITKQTEDNMKKKKDTAVKKENGKLVCMKCYKRIARSTTCPKQYCQKCCENPKCQAHSKKQSGKKQQKQTTKEKSSILNGTNWVNKFAAEKRRQAIRKGAFREEAFDFMGDTLLVWSMKEFFEKDMWKEDAIERVTKKREKGKLEIGSKKKVGDVGRFHKLLDQRIDKEKSV